MEGIISIQSNLVYGHGGNSAAVFPVQRMGLEIWPINTAQYSNHSQYQQGWTGRCYPASDIRELLHGLGNIEQLAHCKAIISGHQASEAQCIAVKEAVMQVKSQSAAALYVCDPSLDGSYQKRNSEQAVSQHMLTELMPMADVIVANLSELVQFTHCQIETVAQAVDACKQALALGPKMVLLKNLTFIDDTRYSMMLVTAKTAYLSQRPLLRFKVIPAGIRELLTAIFTACLVKQMSPAAALRHTNNAVYGVLELTLDNGSLELETIGGQYEFVEPTHDFALKKIAIFV